MRLRTIVSACYVGLALLCAGLIGAAAQPVAKPTDAQPYFTGAWQLVPLMVDCKPVRVLPGGQHARCPKVIGGQQVWAEAKTYQLHMSDGTVITVPAGMTTDLASTPRVVWSVLPPNGAYGKASGPHDECYQTRGSFIYHWPDHPRAPPFIGLPVGHPIFSRAGCDEALHEGMVALDVPAWQRIVVYEAVRLGGGSGWGR